MRSRYTENPRTVLAFYATVLGLVLAAVLGCVWILASTGVRTGAIPWLLGFAGAVFVALVAGVFVVTLVDPSKLMLGRVSGTEYAEIQSVRLGDSRTGERELAVAHSGPGAPRVVAELPPAEREATDTSALTDQPDEKDDDEGES